MNSLRSAWTPVLASQNASIIGPRERFEDSPLARTSFASYPTIRLVQIIGQANPSPMVPWGPEYPISRISDPVESGYGSIKLALRGILLVTIRTF